MAAWCSCGESGSNRWEDEIPHHADSGGQTFAQAEADLQAIPGLTLTNLSCTDRPNIKGNTGCSADFEVEAGHEIVDGPGLITYTAETVWTVRDTWMPNVSITISVTGGPDTDFDATAAAHEAGWTDWTESTQGEPGSESNPNGWTRVAVWIRTYADDDSVDARNRERLGEWPGDVPEEPTQLTARVE